MGNTNNKTDSAKIDINTISIFCDNIDSNIKLIIDELNNHKNNKIKYYGIQKNKLQQQLSDLDIENNDMITNINKYDTFIKNNKTTILELLKQIIDIKKDIDKNYTLKMSKILLKKKLNNDVHTLSNIYDTERKKILKQKEVDEKEKTIKKLELAKNEKKEADEIHDKIDILNKNISKLEDNIKDKNKILNIFKNKKILLFDMNDNIINNCSECIELKKLIDNYNKLIKWTENIPKIDLKSTSTDNNEQFNRLQKEIDNIIQEEIDNNIQEEIDNNIQEESKEEIDKESKESKESKEEIDNNIQEEIDNIQEEIDNNIQEESNKEILGGTIRRSPLRRSPLRRSLLRRSNHRSPHRSNHRSSHRSNHRSPHRSFRRSPHKSHR